MVENVSQLVCISENERRDRKGRYRVVLKKENDDTIHIAWARTRLQAERIARDYVNRLKNRKKFEDSFLYGRR